VSSADGGPSWAESLDYMLRETQRQKSELEDRLQDLAQRLTVERGRYRQALEDIASGDETSTLAGAVAIAKGVLGE
jgi:hypothetical protein